MKYRVFDGALYIALEGELDQLTAPILKKAIDKLISNTEYNKIVLDLSEMTFMDSTGVGLIMGRYKLARQLSKFILIKAPTKSVDKVLQVSGIYSIIQKIK
ncbi:MAG: anti-sigma factor antagonist [Bacillota bacterium]